MASKQPATSSGVAGKFEKPKESEPKDKYTSISSRKAAVDAAVKEGVKGPHDAMDAEPEVQPLPHAEPLPCLNAASSGFGAMPTFPSCGGGAPATPPRSPRGQTLHDLQRSPLSLAQERARVRARLGEPCSTS